MAERAWNASLAVAMQQEMPESASRASSRSAPGFMGTRDRYSSVTRSLRVSISSSGVVEREKRLRRYSAASRRPISFRSRARSSGGSPPYRRTRSTGAFCQMYMESVRVPSRSKMAPRMFIGRSPPRAAAAPPPPPSRRLARTGRRPPPRRPDRSSSTPEYCHG